MRNTTIRPPARSFSAVLGVLAITAVWSLVVASPAVAASTLGIDKTASTVSALPGTDFRYTIVPRCSGLTEACLNATVVDVLPPELEVTAVPSSTSERTVSYDAPTRRLTIVYRIQLPPPSPPGSLGLPAGSSNNVEIGVRLPADTQLADGSVVANTTSVTADNAPTARDRADVIVEVPKVVTPVATKSWPDGSAVAGSDEASTMVLGVRNASSSTARVSSLTLDESSPQVFDRFDVTGIGPVSFPRGADRVTVLACTRPLSVCAESDFAASAPQTGPGLSLPAGVSPGQVTGLRFVFTNAAGTALPIDPTGGSVQVSTVLRDTLRSTGATYSPISRDDVENCAIATGTDPVLGDVAGAPACVTYAVQPAQATMTLDKTFFADSDANYAPNGAAVDGESSLVSGLVSARNTSPFPVATMSIVEPSTTSPGEFTKFDVSNVRLVIPAGATSADLAFTCGTDTITRQFVPPPGTVDVPVPCQSGRADGIQLTYSGTDATGNGTIAAGATATLGIQGRLNANVTPGDLVGGASAGVQNCASGTATSSVDGVGSAAAAGCASVAVQPAFSRLQGVKSAELPTILPGLPRTFNLSFTNNGTVPATAVTLLDPPDPTAAGNPFRSIRLVSLTLPASPAATAEVYDPQLSGYLPYDAGDAALLERALGFRIVVTAPLAPGQRYAMSARVLLRDGVPIGTRLQNCASIGTDTQPATGFCAPAITATEPSEGAAVQKAISPASSVRPRPGLPGQTVQVKLAAQNSGTLWLKRLVVTDADPDFFDAVDVTGTIRVNFPPSANRVQVDVCTTGCAAGTFVTGTRTASRTPPLPGGVSPADVRGLRITFSVADDSFTIKPGTNFPTTGACAAASVCIDVIPRSGLHSDPAVAAPDTLSDTAAGGYETTRQNGALAAIPDSTATHQLTAGTAQLRFDKSPDTSTAPGEPIPFTLTLTNTGTGPLPDPVIVDPVPGQLEFAPTNPASPYDHTVVQPAGAPDSPAPVFEPTQDAQGRVASLRWRFPGLVLLPGGSITVTFSLQLAPGVTAGTAIENRGGATAARADLGCADGGRRPGTATGEPAYGAGLYCTSAAVVTTLAGNAIRTEKWVAGDPTLGWMNSLTTEPLPLGDPSCPRLTVGDQLFTRYPCVARVIPGQGFDFYLRATNAGTNPATEIRVVDVFPAPADTGVVLTGEQRGTQWQQAPTLLGPVVPDGSGALDVGYATDSPACTTDLDRPPSACPAGRWTSSFSTGASAFRGILTFPGGLPPGGSSALRFRMGAPAAPSDPIPDMVAWNSFAHTEFFNDGGRTVQLPATEPIKTGVALVFGDVTVAKQVVDSAEAGPFTFAYSCTVTPEPVSGEQPAPVVVATGTFELLAGQSLTTTALPARASCSAWETDSRGLLSDADGPANAKSVTVRLGGQEQVPTMTVTNRAGPTPTPTPTPTPSETSPPAGSTPTPAATAPPAASGSDTGSQPSDALAGTGVSVVWPALLGVLLLAVGAAVLWSTARKNARSAAHIDGREP